MKSIPYTIANLQSLATMNLLMRVAIIKAKSASILKCPKLILVFPLRLLVLLSDRKIWGVRFLQLLSHLRISKESSRKKK